MNKPDFPFTLINLYKTLDLSLFSFCFPVIYLGLNSFFLYNISIKITRTL